MTKFLSSFGFAAALLLGASLLPLVAQYNPPPPPEEQNTGESSIMDQSAPPPDPGQPAPDDASAAPPPPDLAGQPAPDQEGADDGAPLPDNGADASGDVNFQTFYNDLSSQGDWVQTDNYGYVWQPDENDPDWRPYSNGHWVYTDEGWTWVADDSEPWGWATYHYGRWVNLDGYGWVWVPGYTWAPAWVSWRYGGGYCGWAPLPPDTFIGIDFGGVGFGFHIGGDCDTAYDIGPGYYNFIPVAYIGERDYRHHYADRNNNFAIIGNTRNVTNIVVNNQRGAGRFSRVSVGGPSLATVDAQASTPVQRASLARSNRVGTESLNGNRLSVFAPRVSAASGTTIRPSRVAARVTNARVNTGASLGDPLQVTAHVRAPAADPAQVAAARNARFSATAHVATAGTHAETALTRPLSSYQPHEARTTTPGVSASSQVNRAVSHPAASSTREDAFTGGDGAEVHHASGNAETARTFNPDATETHSSVHENAATPQAQVERPTYHAEVPERHEDSHPAEAVQHEDYHPQVQHEEVHAQESHPQQAEHHDAAPPHASAPAAQSSGGGKDAGKDDKKQH